MKWLYVGPSALPEFEYNGAPLSHGRLGKMGLERQLLKLIQMSMGTAVRLRLLHCPYHPIDEHL